MTFEEDLTKRRIDVTAFAAGDPEKFAAWKLLYSQVHPNNFYTSVKMIINDVRRRFWLQEASKVVAAPATAPARPVVRRATVPSTASAIPDEPSPSVDRTPEPVARPRPVVRRPAAPTADTSQEPAALAPPTVPAQEEAAASESPKPGRARPVFRKPAAGTPEIPNTPSEDTPAAAPAISQGSTESPKAPRPRPVFRKPVASAEEETIPVHKAAEIPEHNNPDPAEAPKPPRPRPVFKRPAPVNPESVPENTPTVSLSPAEPGTDLNQPIESAPPVPKFPRPRPVIKRPELGTAAPAGSQPEGVAPVPPATEVSSINVQQPETPAEPVAPKELPQPEALPEVPAAKPPRPRPIFKRPAPPPGSPSGDDPEKE